jgi:hypothetical protein
MDSFKFSEQVRDLYPPFYIEQSERKILTALENADPVFSTIYNSTSGFVDNVFAINTCQSRYLPVIAQSLGVDSFLTFSVLDYYEDSSLSHVVTGFYDNYSRIGVDTVPSGMGLYDYAVSGTGGDGVFLAFANALQADASAVLSISGWDAFIETPYHKMSNLLSVPSGLTPANAFSCACEIYNNSLFIRSEREFLRETLLKLNSKGISNSLKATFMDYILRAFSDDYRKNRNYSGLTEQSSNNFNITVRELNDPWAYYTPWHEQTFISQTFEPMSGMMDQYRTASTQAPMTSAFAELLINMFPAPLDVNATFDPFNNSAVEINDVIRGYYYTAGGYLDYRRDGVDKTEFDNLAGEDGVITYAKAVAQGVEGVIPNWSDYIANERGVVATLQDPYSQFAFEDVFEYFSNRGKGEWRHTDHTQLANLEYEKNVRMWLPYRSMQESTDLNRYAPVSGAGEWALPALSGLAGYHIKKSEADIYKNVYCLFVPQSGYSSLSDITTINNAGSGYLMTHSIIDSDKDAYGEWSELVLPQFDIQGTIKQFYALGSLLMVIDNADRVYLFDIDGIGSLNETYPLLADYPYVAHLYDEGANTVYLCLRNGTAYGIYSYDLTFNVLVPYGTPPVSGDVGNFRMFKSPNGFIGLAGVQYTAGIPTAFRKYMFDSDLSSTNSIGASAVDGFMYGQGAEILGDSYIFTYATSAGNGIPFSRALMLRNVISENEIPPVSYMVGYDYQYLFTRADDYLWTDFTQNKILFNSMRSRDNVLIGISAPMSGVERYEGSGADGWLATISNHMLDNDTTNAVSSGSTVSGAWFNYFIEGIAENITHNDLLGVSGGFINISMSKMRNVMDENHAVAKVGITHTPMRYFGADLFDTVFLYGYDYDNSNPVMEAVSKWYFYSRHDVKTGLFDIYINNFKFSDDLSNSEVDAIRAHIESVIRDSIWMVKPITSELRYVVWNNCSHKSQMLGIATEDGYQLVTEDDLFITME